MKFFQYQTFPDAKGMVDSEAKLKAFSLPDVKGKSFLDIGCNEGFYCDWAHRNGAERVVGLDGSEVFINAARKRFPNIEFLCRSWERLPDEKFDVILWASCMHYIPTAEAAAAQLSQIASRLANGGVLVLETGVDAGQKLDLVTHTRSNGEKVYYPTMAGLIRILEMSNLVHRFKALSEAGDQVPRHVYHCVIRQPVLMILTGGMNVGKTRAGYALTVNDQRRIVNVDAVITDAYEREYPGDLAEKFSADRSNFNGIKELFQRKGAEASTFIATELALHIVNTSKQPDGHWQQGATILDGLDLKDTSHQSVLAALYERLPDFIVWTAQRSA